MQSSADRAGTRGADRWFRPSPLSWLIVAYIGLVSTHVVRVLLMWWTESRRFDRQQGDDLGIVGFVILAGFLTVLTLLFLALTIAALRAIATDAPNILALVTLTAIPPLGVITIALLGGIGTSVITLICWAAVVLVGSAATVLAFMSTRKDAKVSGA